MMCRVFCVVLVLALLCCCSCVFAAKEEEEQQPQVTQVNAVCAGRDKLGRWQLPGKSLWYNCTAATVDFGQMICSMGVGNCASEASQSRTKGVAKDGVFTINVSTFTQNQVKNWWERNVEKAVTAAIVPAKPPAALTPGSQEHKAPGDATKKIQYLLLLALRLRLVPLHWLKLRVTLVKLVRLNLWKKKLRALKKTIFLVKHLPDRILNLLLLSLRIPRMYLPLLYLQLQAALVLTLLLALRPRRILLLRPRKRRIPLPLMIFKALHILPLLLLLHPNPYQIRSPQKTAATSPMNLQWSCRKRLLLRHRLSCPRPASTGVQRKAPKRIPPPTPPTPPPAKEILRRQACRLPFPLRPQRTHWRTVWELTPASMTPVCMPCHRLFWLRSPTGHWAEEVNAGYKCQHSTTWICELLLFYCLIINGK
ncbi:serine-alanine-and proline-rich protein [Trypanosoma cruzi Dm28c]|uniref:Serine-alanine-and proline-rich protein n=1 Tax=Trypanosoma cruzi Dm28c TaxID=1416333 RepID=V5BBB9_TRYCR|nr:serine-alanine-and proline-rich protein [Trypanosoma cruzi Dm28c]